MVRRKISDEGNRVPVAIAKGADRSFTIGTVIQSLGEIDCQGKDVYLKASFNSADPYPASTHPEALATVVRILRERECRKVILVERSGMGRTREVWQRLGISDLAKELDLTLIALDDLAADAWRREELPGSHWKEGVEVPRFLQEGTCLVQICNLKTHRFGGHFSASLKNSIGLLPKYSPTNTSHNYMTELHDSLDQRLMIAEVNQIYSPSLVVMDASQVFIDGGPEAGNIASPEVALASRDRVAIDAAGAALLRIHGAGPPVGTTPVFEQEQIKRAVELNLGAASGEEIHFITSDRASANLAFQLRAILSQKSAEEKKS